MNLKQNWLIITSLFCSVVGLVLIYVAALNIQPTEISILDITPELIGRTATTTGYITYKSEHAAGHIFLTIEDDDAKIQVPLFAGFMSELNRNNITSHDFKKGNKISVTGLVEDYKGQLQIVPRKVSDIKILSD